jgi:eukaryotic-like serine/threonine-protein kinase
MARFLDPGKSKKDGELLFGRFEVHERLGTGAHAEVFKVVDPLTGQIFALKVLTAENPEIRERTYQEGQILARLRHPNIVSAKEVILHLVDVCFLMEYIEGSTLRELIKDRKLTSLEEVLDLFRQILSGLEAAHRAGILHRDLKPSNILCVLDKSAVGEDGSENARWIPKLIDFGAAHADAAPESGLGSATLMGTPGYMAPEQLIEGVQIGPEADVFALGCILYEALAYRPAYRKKDPMDTVKATVAGSFVPLQDAAPGMPTRVCQAVNRSLTPNPRARFQSCDEFAMALYGERLKVPSQAAIGSIMSSPEAPRRIDSNPVMGVPEPPAQPAVVEDEVGRDWVTRAYLVIVLVGVVIGLCGLVFYALRFLAPPA